MKYYAGFASIFAAIMIPEEAGMLYKILLGVTGIIFIALAIKEGNEKDKHKNQVLKVTQSLKEALNRVDQGESLEQVAEWMRAEKDVPEIITVKYLAYMTDSYVTDNLVGIIQEGNFQEVADRFALIEYLSEPFLKTPRTVEEEIDALDEKVNLVFMQENAMLQEVKDENKKGKGSGTLIVTTRYLFWFPKTFNLENLWNDGNMRKLASKVAEQIPGVGLGVNALLFTDSTIKGFSNEPFFTDEKKADLKKLAQHKKFLAIPIREVQSITVPIKLKDRLLANSSTISLSDERKFHLIVMEDGLTFAENMFEQFKLTALLHGHLFIPEDFNNPKNWVVWDIRDMQNPEAE
ncbi:hypothetical protein KFE98_08150 [bacterium SCSIO 12741]|nr:hypothetical protein KFE98_08150 [bacterium SCSIO 12741]